MGIDEFEFTIDSSFHILEINKNGGYHAYPNYSRKEYRFESNHHNLRKKGIDIVVGHIKLYMPASDIYKYFKKKIRIEANANCSQLWMITTRIILGIQFMNFDTNKWEEMPIKSITYLGYREACDESMVLCYFSSEKNNQRFINKDDLSIKIKIRCLPKINKSDLD